MLTEVDDKQLIAITPEWMKEKFDEMNQLLFNGELKPCRLGLFTTGKGSQGHTLGWFKHSNLRWDVRTTYNGKHPCYVIDYWGDKVWLDGDNFNKYANPEIQLNGHYNWTEKAALSTLVHEMCHYYDFKDGWEPMQAHGPNFRRIAEMVSRKSNEFFTVERLAKAEQMQQMDFTDDFKAFNNRRAAKGIHVIKMEFNGLRKGKSGRMWKFAYMVPASTKYQEYIEWVKNSVGEGKTLKCACDCITTDGMIKKYRTSKSHCITFRFAATWDDLVPDVKIDSETWYGSRGDGEAKQNQVQPSNGFSGNQSVKQVPQPEKRYSFTMKTWKNGVEGLFTISNATEEEAKEQMRKRFPNWTEAMIDTKFKMYTQNQSMVGESIIGRYELQQIVEQVCQELVEERRIHSAT